MSKYVSIIAVPPIMVTTTNAITNANKNANTVNIIIILPPFIFLIKEDVNSAY